MTFQWFLFFVVYFIFLVGSETDVKHDGGSGADIGVLLKKTAESSHSQKHVHNSHHHTSHHALRAANLTHLPFDYSDPRWNPRFYNPRGINLGWVVNASPDYIKIYANEISALTCYCLLYQIRFYVEPILVDDKDIRDYQQVKLKNVMKYLRFHDWLLITDADMMVHNYSQSIFSFIDDRFDVILHERDISLEIDAGLIS
jgi:hypothetical protein